MPKSVSPTPPPAVPLHMPLALRIVATVTALLLLFIFVFYWTRWMKDSEQTTVDATKPTQESFRKSYVYGCELGNTTFDFGDGAKLSGEFASCPGDRSVSFFATTTTLRVTGKDPLTVHTVMAKEGDGEPYPAASVYMKLPQAMLDIMFNGMRPSATATPESLGITPKMMTMADIQEAATSSESFMVLHGYVIGMHMKKSTGSGFWFDPATLTFTSN